MPDLAAFGVAPLPLWTVAAALLVLFLLVSTISVRRSGSFGPVAALFGIPALAVIAWSVWNFADHAILHQQIMEREALESRVMQLTASAMTDPVLACLDSGTAEAVESACEAAIFAKPETVAA